ncbi:MAG: hypothetical protein H7257_11185 [Taibaiella sp.]|nr:hypothetical protein [Taibaiella sp.]
MDYGNEKTEIFELAITERAKGILLNMAWWAKFLAIIGFIIIGIMVLVFGGIALVQGSESSGMFGRMGMGGGGPLASIMLAAIMAGIYFYPTYALLMYAIKVKKAVLAADKFEFESAVNHLKNMFKFMGILMIAFIVIYGIVLVGAAVVLTRL